MTILFLALDLVLFFNNYVNPIGLDKIHWKYYIVFDCWLFAELLCVYFFFVETRNTPLEEIVRYFDGEDALLGGDLANEKSRQLEQVYEIAPDPASRDMDEKTPVAEQVEKAV